MGKQEQRETIANFGAIAVIKPGNIGFIMTKNIVTISPDSDIRSAARLMHDNKISCVVVSNGTPIGIVTERDIVRMAANEEDFEKTLSEVMSSPLVRASSGTPFNKALDIMRANHIRRLPIVERKVLKGLVTETDLLIASRKELLDMGKQYRNVRAAAIKDKLTGLYNRHYFHTLMEQELNKARRYGALLSLIMIDVDHFKNVNDRFGHVVGDTILKKISKILKVNARDVDVVIRYGGEEFVIICPISGTRSAKLLAERMCKTVEETQLKYKGVKFKVTISAGICKYTSVYSSMRKIVAGADKALYQAKQNGRNQVCVATG
jgi:diguanylate cyclase (GGDEF)-like protein